MSYNEWIKREKKIRIKILQSSPIIQKTYTYRVCQNCSEKLLCHEENCPNCNSNNITNQVLENINIEDKIRCQFRFEHLEKKG